MRGHFWGFLLVFCFVPVVSFAQFNNETITIATYYPSPYGVYRSVRLVPSEEPADAASKQPGMMYFNNTTEQIYFYKNATVGWQPMAAVDSGLPLFGATHTQGDCEKDGGTMITNPDGTGLAICKFSKRCPSGWAPYKNWSQTTGGKCDIPGFSCPAMPKPTPAPCTCASNTTYKVSNHAWSNKALEQFGTYDQSYNLIRMGDIVNGDTSTSGTCTCVPTYYPGQPYAIPPCDQALSRSIVEGPACYSGWKVSAQGCY
jgi:hypothetical protein